MAPWVTVGQRHFEEVRPARSGGLIVTNPPYGERLQLPRAAAFYRRLGDWLVQHAGGWRAAILAADTPAAGQVGLRPTQRVPLANGPIACRLLEVEVRKRAAPSRASVEGPGPAEPTRPAAAASREMGGAGEHESIVPPGDDADSPGAFGGPGATSAPEAHGRVRGRTTDDQIGDFRCRLATRFKHLGKWARRQDIEAFRVYDRDIPEIPLVIDLYAGSLHAAEYERPHERTDIEHDVWLDRMIEAAGLELGVPPMQTFQKVRRRERDGGQPEKVDQRQVVLAVKEGGLVFEVNLSDYLDTGLFLDHRQTRALVRAEAAGMIRWFRLAHLLDGSAAAAMLAWENSGFSVDASVRITLVDRDVHRYFQSLEHLLRYCTRPPSHSSGSP